MNCLIFHLLSKHSNNSLFLKHFFICVSFELPIELLFIGFE